MTKQDTTRTSELVMAAKIEATVAPSRMAMRAWTILNWSEERGLMKMSQMA